jgi:hypothetical protein
LQKVLISCAQKLQERWKAIALNEGPHVDLSIVASINHYIPQLRGCSCSVQGLSLQGAGQQLHAQATQPSPVGLLAQQYFHNFA